MTWAVDCRQWNWGDLDGLSLDGQGFTFLTQNSAILARWNDV